MQRVPDRMNLLLAQDMLNDIWSSRRLALGLESDTIQFDYEEEYENMDEYLDESLGGVKQNTDRATQELEKSIILSEGATGPDDEDPRDSQVPDPPADALIGRVVDAYGEISPFHYTRDTTGFRGQFTFDVSDGPGEVSLVPEWFAVSLPLNCSRSR